MRQGPNGRRPRRHGGGGHNGGHSGHGERNGGNGHSRSHGGGGGGDGGYRQRSASSLRSQTFDSNGPEVRVRGNAWQVFEKYQALARDATSNGDPVLAENLLQHAEHYYRIIEAINEATEAEQRQRQTVYGNQPEMPNNYYAPNGAGLMPPGAPVTVAADGSQQPMAQAEVQVRTPPKPAFFTPDEVEETGALQPPLVAQR